ncbi:ribonuclease III [Geosmithia morbida]|uniref:Ribonuclease III n=1 Tax=Geosmithia morbida TaxID=1094350 RepID=A0A9P5D4S7_9HYPO|nr:ribonuclease III [Geosmithia morbida]KAF4126422.1 ribonuclease III [Geosmithia morbida]
MSKRPHSEARRGNDVSKRPRLEGDVTARALEDIASNADELIAYLEALKAWQKNEDPASPFSHAAELGTLSRELSGSFEVLQNIPSKIGDNHDVSGSPLECAPIPSWTVKPWTVADIPREMPPLPKIKDATLERQAFTHPGVAGHNGYERLEWLGDAYLELIATALIDRTFPTMPSGRCSQVREQLVRNITLSRFFRDYNMDAKAILPPDFKQDLAAQRAGRGRSSDKDVIKTQGDMFEAYVAAVILDDKENGLANCIKWLRDVWSMAIKDHIVREEKDGGSSQQKPNALAEAPQPASGDAQGGVEPTSATQDGEEATTKKKVSPKEQLAKLIVVKGIDIKYKDIPGKEKKDRYLGLPLFTVGVYLTGWGENDKLLGWGTALNKKEAGQKAAMRAIENKKQLKIYCQKKQQSMAAAAAEVLEAGITS